MNHTIAHFPNNKKNFNIYLEEIKKSQKIKKYFNKIKIKTSATFIFLL